MCAEFAVEPVRGKFGVATNVQYRFKVIGRIDIATQAGGVVDDWELLWVPNTYQ